MLLLPAVTLVMVGLVAAASSGDPNEQVISANRTATAVAHQAAELANALAQAKITRTPTPTSTPSPMATIAPAAVSMPMPNPPSPTPLPALPVPAVGADPVEGYLRPSLRQDGQTLELALPQGRWDVRFTVPDCLAPWTNVELEPNAIVLGMTDPWPACDLAGASWSSDAPCALDDAGQCDVLADDSYWDMLGRTLPTETPTPTPAPTVTQAPVPPQPAAPAAARPVVPPPAVQRFVETVVVTATPEAAEVAAPTPSPSPTAATRTPTRAATATAARAATPAPTLLPTRVPTSARAAQAPSERWDWTAFLAGVAGLVWVVGTLTWLLTRRRVAVWRAQPISKHPGGSHA